VDVAVAVLALAATVTLVAGLARWRGLHAPLLLTAVGVGGSFLPFVPQVRLDPELVLVGLLPPLLYATAIRSSLIDFKTHWRAIGLLSVGLVAFTALGVGLLTWWLLPLPSAAAAFAFGAVVAPPDAVATTAVARRIGLPRRIVTVLEGESLLDDATALVALGAAIAALSGTVSFGGISLDFARATLGGAAAGLAVAFLIGWIRHRVTDPVIDTALSFMAPFAAYLPAEAIHGSGVVAVVVTGLVLAHRGSLQQNAASRLSERVNWSTISFLLENTVFLLIGLQARWIVEDVRGSILPPSRIILFCAAALVGVIVLRPLWVFPLRYLIVRPGTDQMGRTSPWTHTAVVSWAGTRGVTLAAAFVLPERTPHREVLVLAAMVVTAGTLLLQGISLPWLARRLDVRGPDPREDVLQEATVLQASVSAGLAELERADPDLDPSIIEALRDRAQRRADMAWERLGRTEPARETPTETWRRLRLQMLLAERAAVLEIRSAGQADHEVIEAVLSALDLEELMLDRVAEDREGDLREGWLLRPEDGGGGCEHLTQAPSVQVPESPWVCRECERDGVQWVHLRLCLDCGNVGCCSSSPGNHAERHFRDAGHPVMRSFEPGEAWRWCYVDDLLG